MTNLDSTLKSGDITLPTKVQLSQSYSFSSSHVWIWELDHEEGWGLKNWCFWTVVLEKTLESPLDCNEIQPVNPKGNQSWIFIHWKDWCWTWNSNTLAPWCEEPTHWKRHSCWERLKVGGEGGDRGWDGWMASLTLWTRVWANLGRQWRRGKPGVLQSMGSQRVSRNWTARTVCVYMLGCVQLFATPWTLTLQTALSTGFPRQEYWSALPFLTPGDVPDSGIEPTSLKSPALAGRLFNTEPPRKPSLISS